MMMSMMMMSITMMMKNDDDDADDDDDDDESDDDDHPLPFHFLLLFGKPCVSIVHKNLLMTPISHLKTYKNMYKGLMCWFKDLLKTHTH